MTEPDPSDIKPDTTKDRSEPPPGTWAGRCPSDTVDPPGWRVCFDDDEQIAYGRTREDAIARAWAERELTLGRWRLDSLVESRARDNAVDPADELEERYPAAAREAGREEGRREERHDFVTWLRVMGDLFPEQAANGRWLADEYEKVAWLADPSPKSTEPAARRNGDHVIIPSDYPGEAAIHVMRHRDGDFGIAVAKGDRWPGAAAATMCSSGGRNPDAWQAVAALWRSAKPTEAATMGGTPERYPGPTDWGHGTACMCVSCCEATDNEAAPEPPAAPLSEPAWVEVEDGRSDDTALLTAEHRGFHLFVWERYSKWTAGFTDTPGGPEWTRDGYEDQAAAQRAVVSIADSLAHAAAAPQGAGLDALEVQLPAALWPTDDDADLVETAARNLDAAREVALEEGLFGEEEANEDVEDCNLLRALAVRLRNAARIVREARTLAAPGAPMGAGTERRYATGAEIERALDAANALREAASSYAEAADLSDPSSSEDAQWLTEADDLLLSTARVWVASLPGATQASAPQAPCLDCKGSGVLEYEGETDPSNGATERLYEPCGCDVPEPASAPHGWPAGPIYEQRLAAANADGEDVEHRRVLAQLANGHPNAAREIARLMHRARPPMPRADVERLAAPRSVSALQAPTTPPHGEPAGDSSLLAPADEVLQREHAVTPYVPRVGDRVEWTVSGIVASVHQTASQHPFALVDVGPGSDKQGVSFARLRPTSDDSEVTNG